MDIKPSKQLEELIKIALEAKEKGEQRSGNLKKLEQELEGELKEALDQLKKAMETLADNVTDKTRQAELEARRKVETLRMEKEGSKHRKSLVFTEASTEGAKAKQSVKQAARQEALQKWGEVEPDLLNRIEAAKAEYLSALKAYHDTMQACNNIFTESCLAVGVDFESQEIPHSVHLPLFTYRASGFNYYGMFDDEVNGALKRGIIKKGAIRLAE